MLAVQQYSHHSRSFAAFLPLHGRSTSRTQLEYDHTVSLGVLCTARPCTRLMRVRSLSLHPNFLHENAAALAIRRWCHLEASKECREQISRNIKNVNILINIPFAKSKNENAICFIHVSVRVCAPRWSKIWTPDLGFKSSATRRRTQFSQLKSTSKPPSKPPKAEQKRKGQIASRQRKWKLESKLFVLNKNRNLGFKSRVFKIKSLDFQTPQRD